MAVTVKAKPPARESTLVAAEKRIGSPIPDGYRNFLRAMYGGRPVEDSFPVDRDAGVDWFMGADEIVEAVGILRDRLRPDLIPIAAAPGGNKICISVHPDRRGAIYFWDHERDDLDDSAVRWLAASFGDFVSQLEVSPPVQLSPERVISVSIDPEFHRWAKEQEALEDARPQLVWPPRSAPQH